MIPHGLQWTTQMDRIMIIKIVVIQDGEAYIALVILICHHSAQNAVLNTYQETWLYKYRDHPLLSCEWKEQISNISFKNVVW
jgi:hypothetical protein